ncbi:KIR protein [Plasmodium coatneyi]|uniref:KIR protein n=1 Tax=Plasmodium coatneyi TaxID=208452 RepID=A0A1B1DV63_9APIC|nr:KIR protein [Plasmodium coatneyi]ANQ06681.1 KIR protein [Plasmodium coatneyi]
MSEEGGQFLKKDNLSMLASKLKFYDKVQGEKVHCELGTQKETSVKDKLKSCTEIKNEIDEIAKGLCKASTMKDDANLSAQEGDSDLDELDKLFNKSLCHFLYFWLGKEVWTRVGNDGTKFLDVMGKIYDALSDFGVQNNCTLLYTNNPPTTLNNQPTINKDLFLHRKTVFDFTFDYKGIKDKLQWFSNACDDGYYKHLQSAQTAFSEVLTDCKSKWSQGTEGGKNPTNDDLYCSWFKNTFDVINDQSPLILSHNGTSMSKGESEKEVTVYNHVHLELNFASKANPTATIVSSLLSVVGLPTTAFFLYKYNLLPSAIKNIFFRGGGGSTNNNRSKTRKGRSGRRDLDTLTAADSSTIYSTEYSTIDDDSTETSTLYDRPHRKGRTNNSRPQQQQMQRNNRNEERRRTNIRYHP